MGFIITQKIGNKTLSGFYRKIETEGDASRFISSENGLQELISFADATAESATNYLFELGFSYLVGANQLMVFASVSELTATNKKLGYILIPQYSTQLVSGVNPAAVTYEEVSSTTVRIKFLNATVASSYLDFLFLVPHTATAAISREKMVVKDQGDNIAIELEGHGDGLLLQSPNGVKWLVRIDDSGNLVSEAR